MKLPVISDRPSPRAAPTELDRLLGTIDRLQEVVDCWEQDNQKNAVAALISSIEDLHKEAFVRVIRAVRAAEPGQNAAASLRAAAEDDVVYAVLRRLGVLKPSMSERLDRALASVRPMLASHGGDVELVEIGSSTEVTIRLLGACDGCPASGLTLREGVEKAIREECPEIETVSVARGSAIGSGNVSFVSPFARAEDDGWLYASELDELKPRCVRPLRLDNRSILLWRSSGDEVAAYDNMCAHLGMPLDDGDINDGVLTCPHHGFRFVMATGECLTAPEAQLVTHAVRVVANRVEVKIL